MLTPLAIDLYLPAMPAMAIALDVSHHWIQWTLSFFVAGFAFGQLVHGPLSDTLGRRPVMLAGMLGFAFCSLLIAMIEQPLSLLLMRFIQGLCAAAPAVLIAAILRDQVRTSEFARLMSLVTLVLVLAPLVAPMLGSLLLYWLNDWHWLFLLLAIMACVCALVLYWRLPETLASSSRQPWHLKNSLADYGRLLAQRQSLSYLLVGSLPLGAMFVFLSLGSFVYMGHYGLNEFQFSLLFAGNVLALMALTLVNSKLVRRFGPRNMLLTGLSLQLLLGGLMVVGSQMPSVFALAVPLSLFVGCVSLIGANALACLFEHTQVMPGTVSALAGSSRFAVGGGIGFIVSLVANSDPLTLALSMALCPLLALLLFFSLQRTGAKGSS